MRLAAFPRVRLGHFPTPLEPLAGLSRFLAGPRIFVKRDDCSGLATGGSKVRKLEYALGAALEQRADTVLIHGSIQSNHARLVAAAAARLGLRCIVLLEERLPGMPDGYRRSGNVLLDRIFGAQVRLFERGADLDARLDEACDEVRAAGGRPYVLRGGAPAPDGIIGYAAGALELLQQSIGLGLDVDCLVMASESGGVQAGWVVGHHALNVTTKILGVAVSQPRPAMQARIHALAVRTADYLGIDRPVPRVEVEVEDRFVGPGPGRPGSATLEAIELAARLDGLLLDPIYTGKALAALVALVREGRFTAGQTVVFLHTGGLPLVFAHQHMFSTAEPAGAAGRAEAGAGD